MNNNKSKSTKFKFINPDHIEKAENQANRLVKKNEDKKSLKKIRKENLLKEVMKGSITVRKVDENNNTVEYILAQEDADKLVTKKEFMKSGMMVANAHTLPQTRDEKISNEEFKIIKVEESIAYLEGKAEDFYEIYLKGKNEIMELHKRTKNLRKIIGQLNSAKGKIPKGDEDNQN